MTTRPRRLRLGMVGGGRGAFIGAVHRIAARLDDQYELVAGALSSDTARADISAAALISNPLAAMPDFEEMAEQRGGAAGRHRCGGDRDAQPSALRPGPDLPRPRHPRDLRQTCHPPARRRIDSASAVGRSRLIFALTHNYTGYPLVRQARDMAASGALGTIRVVQVEYPQDWLTTRLEETGHKQAAWRTDPARSGNAGCIGDIGTHAFYLAEFVTGLRCESVAAELTRFVKGRALDDNAQMLLRFSSGARGMLWSSQVAPGNENALRLRVYGEKAGLDWSQDSPTPCCSPRSEGRRS